MLVTTLVTVSTRLSTLYHAKSVINSLLNAASRTIAQSLSASKSGGSHKPCQLGPHLRYYRSVALSYHNGTTTPCLSLSLPVPSRVINP